MFGKKPKPAADRLVLDEDLIPDRRLVDTTEDRFDHEALARAVAEIAIAGETPINIALFGAWGSGKSSVYSMIAVHLNKLTGRKTAVVRYDAWKYGGKALKRNFIESVQDELNLTKDTDGPDLHETTEVSELKLARWLRRNWCALTLGVVVAIVVAGISLGLLGGAAVILASTPFRDALRDSIGPAGTVLGLALIALLVGPKALEGAVKKTPSTPPSDDDQFATRFNQLVATVRKVKSADRLVVFIDELDRCSPDDVVSTLIDLKTFLDQPDCVFIVAVDRDVIERSLRAVPQAKPVRDDEPYYATPGAFLDKIFQHQIALPPLRPRALTRFAYSLVEDQGGLWAEIRNQDAAKFEAVIFTLVPAHVSSPRRVKVLLNNFAANARIAQARNLAWIERTLELAVLTVLDTEFPSVAADLVKVPRLLEFIRGDSDPTSSDVTEVVARYQLRPTDETPSPNDDNRDSSRSPAGELLNDGVSTTPARDTLNRQLLMYLEKIRAGGIPDPKPDLFYLQHAGRAESRFDPKLGDMIDFASDTAPDVLVAAFDGKPSKVLAAAVPLIVAVGDDNFGPGRFLALESACRLVEQMDIAEVQTISREISPTVLAAAKSDMFRLQAIPGAVVLSLLTSSKPQIADIIGLAAANDTDGTLVERIANALPHAPTEESVVDICTLLASGYRWRTKPVHSALRTLPLEIALKLWSTVGDSLCDTIIELETETETASEAAAKSAAATATPTAASTPPAPAPAEDGPGRQRICELLDIAASRGDGEKLTSAIFTTLQQSTAKPLKKLVTELAKSTLEGLSDPTVVTTHVLTGLINADSQDWLTWSSLLPPNAKPAKEEIAASATEYLAGHLLPGIPVELDQTVLSAIPEICERIAHLAPNADADSVKTALSLSFANLVWDLDRGEPAIAGLTDEIRTRQREIAHHAADTLRTIIGDSTVDETLAADIQTGFTTVHLIETVQSEILRLIDQLPASAAKLASKALDNYPAPEGEELQQCQLRLHARVRFNGPPLDRSQLPELDDQTISDDILDRWLELRPPVADAGALIELIAGRRQALKTYAESASVADRSSLWVAAEKNAVADGPLRDIGNTGVDAVVVEHMSSQLGELTRQQDRDRLVERLLTAQLANSAVLETARKAASQLAATLLNRKSAGDAKLAARVIIWSGGAARGHVQTLRQQFDEAITQRSNAFNKSTQSKLAELRLATPKRKGPLSWLFDN